MLKPLVTRFLQHITSQNEWSRPHLQPFAGKVVQFNFVLAKTNLLILEDGSLALSGETHAPEATIHVPPSLALRLLARDEAAKMFIKIDGDTHLATEFSKVLQNMRWDIEEDLSHVTGDIAAFKIGEFTKKAFTEMRQQSISAAEMLSEFWQEEKPILAKKRHVEQFNVDVDTLKSDVARFEKKLQKLNKKMAESAKP
jgi:ubiquinone biosynthesis accessory factor UbiJ